MATNHSRDYGFAVTATRGLTPAFASQHELFSVAQPGATDAKLCYCYCVSAGPETHLSAFVLSLFRLLKNKDTVSGHIVR